MKIGQQEEAESKQEGFTLIQLVIVVAIIGILVAIGIPAYGGIVKETRKAAYAGEAQKVAETIVARFVQEGGTLAGESWDNGSSNAQLMERIGREVVHDLDPEFESRAWDEPPASGHWVNLQGVGINGEWPAWEIAPQIQVYDLDGDVFYEYGGTHRFGGNLE
ncbi:hypothetical protein DBR36_03530 [Microbacterium sp. HMWF026]|uniref:pilin n=1 Tax=Microbacterium sp. HMWF026 TaxID=2056861 RepID=UPI000D3B2BD8|nr:type II secretion system protein [Microbacterium sp. HMWF026]PTT21730.1 hypothetical protein DBR36_03530 [Microbacterium sp. HMWF026]